MHYLKRCNGKGFNINSCKGYDSSAPLAAHKARARAVADHEHVTCKVIDDNGNVVFIAYAR